MHISQQKNCLFQVTLDNSNQINGGRVMDRYEELIGSLEKYRDFLDEQGHSVLAQTAEALLTLQGVVNEKQKLLDEAMDDLSKSNDCKYCAHINECSAHRIERNLVYGGCANWTWRGAKTICKAS